MKSLKIAVAVVLAALFMAPAFTGCKKGENDPMSLKSRKARVTGEWELTEGTITVVNGGTTYTITYNGSTCTVTSGSFTGTAPYTEKVEILKDGTYEVNVNDDGDISIETGVWYFGGKSKELELKNKESIIFRTLSSTYTPQGGTASITTYDGTYAPTYSMNIDELRSKKMVVIYDGSETDSGGVYTETGTKTYEQ